MECSAVTKSLALDLQDSGICAVLLSSGCAILLSKLVTRVLMCNCCPDDNNGISCTSVSNLPPRIWGNRQESLLYAWKPWCLAACSVASVLCCCDFMLGANAAFLVEAVS